MKTAFKLFSFKSTTNHPAFRVMFAFLLFLAMPFTARAQTLSQIYNLVNTINNRVAVIKSQVVTGIPNQVSSVKSDTTEMVTKIGYESSLISGDLQTMVTNTISDVQAKATVEEAGLGAFLSSTTNGPTQLKTNIIAFLTSVQTIVNTLRDATGSNAKPLDLSLETRLISATPDASMFPLSKAFQLIDFSKITAVLNGAATNLLVLGEGLVTTNACEVIMNAPATFERAVTVAGIESAYLKVSGRIVQAKGEEDQPEATAGGGGWVDVDFNENPARTAGEILEAVGQGLWMARAVVQQRLNYCTRETYDTDLVGQLNGVQGSMNTLNTMISALASKASVNALAVALTNATAPLDVPVSTRATQASMDTLTGIATNQQTMLLRMQVELRLTDNTRQLSMFYLPERFGGELGFVRSVVADTIATNEAAGLYSGTAAGQVLQAGDAAAATNDFHDAFNDYSQAYQDVVKWPVTTTVQASPTNGVVDLTWPSDAGGIYSVETSSNLVTWHSLLPNVVGTAGQTKDGFSASGGKGFYRVFRVSSFDPAVTVE